MNDTHGMAVSWLVIVNQICIYIYEPVILILCTHWKKYFATWPTADSLMTSILKTKQMTAKQNDNMVCSLVSTFMVTPIISLVFMGRGRQASTKPNVITRNDLLRAAEKAPIRPSPSLSVSSTESYDSRKRKRSSRKVHYE